MTNGIIIRNGVKYAGGSSSSSSDVKVVDVVEKGNKNAVSSNAVANAADSLLEEINDPSYQLLQNDDGTLDLNNIVTGGRYYYSGMNDVANAPEDCQTIYSGAEPTSPRSTWFFLTVETTLDFDTTLKVSKLIIYQTIHTTHNGMTGDYHRRCYCTGSSYDSSVDTWSAWVKNSTSREIKNYEKKIAMFGGSVAANSLPYLFPHIEDVLGTRKLYSYAVGGAGFNAGTNFREQIQSMITAHPTEKIDVALFWCSTNDWNSTARGQYTDYSYYNNWGQSSAISGAATVPETNMCSSMNYCFKTLYDYNPNIEIYVILPLRCYTRREGWDIYYNKWNYEETGNTKYPFQRWVDAMKQVCNVWCIPCLDLWNASGINFYNETSFLSDHLHPTEAGYNKIKYQIAEFLKNGGFGSFNPILCHQDENGWVFPFATVGEIITPCRNGDGVGNALSDYVNISGTQQPYYIRDGICICSIGIDVSGGDISTNITPLLRGFPKCQGISNTDVASAPMVQCPLICRSGTNQYTTAYAYLTSVVNSSTKLRETVLFGDGLKDGASYRGFICYPVEDR